MIIAIVAIVALVAFWLFRRGRPAPHGTYDDKDVRSSGSIGGGTRAYDTPEHRSSGSIGGQQRATDSAAHKSGGSIGNSTVATTEEEELERHEQRRQRGSTLPPLEGDRPEEFIDDSQPPNNTQTERETERRVNDDKFRSGGSFGSS
jgi:hypothetical protein